LLTMIMNAIVIPRATSRDRSLPDGSDWWSVVIADTATELAPARGGYYDRNPI